VLFQGGAAALREAYRAAAAASGSHLLFSTEHQPYPEEVGPLFPPAPGAAVASAPSSSLEVVSEVWCRKCVSARLAGAAPFRYLNSGMWAGPVGAVLELLETLVGVRRGESLPALLDIYLNWDQHTARASPTPRVYVDNDQTAYACLFVSQHLARACGARGGSTRRPRVGGRARCVTCPHDGQRRCVRANGSPDCSAGGGRRLGARLGLDYSLRLFENMFKAGAHRLEGGTLRHSSSGATPLAVHFNGPAKVVHDARWRLPQWGGKPDMPRQLRDALCASLPAAERAAADARFASHVTFLDPTFRRVSGGIGHLNSTCLGVVAA